MTAPHTPPSLRASSFNCPHCHAFANQLWGAVYRFVEKCNHGAIPGGFLGTCTHCNNFTIWLEGKLIYPITSTAPNPNQDLPNDIKQDYEEARQIAPLSPKGAAALLRLSIQKICKHLGGEGKNINNDIAQLVENGLPVKIQQALDIVRVVGNNAVHPGQIVIEDNNDTVNKLFGLVNVIANVMITQPKHIEEMYRTVIPENLQEAIENRDKA